MLPTRKRLEALVVDVQVLDAKLLDAPSSWASMRSMRFWTWPKQLLDRQSEGVDRALHALEQVHAHAGG